MADTIKTKNKILALKKPDFRFAKILVTRDNKNGEIVKRKIVELFDPRVSADYSTIAIKSGKTKYSLNYKLHCSIEIADGAVFIENDMLAIFGQGQTLDEAEKSFGEEFDYIYNRYNELPDKKLTKDVVNIKKALNLLVKNVRK